MLWLHSISTESESTGRGPRDFFLSTVCGSDTQLVINCCYNGAENVIGSSQMQRILIEIVVEITRMEVLWKDRSELSRGVKWLKTKKRLLHQMLSLVPLHSAFQNIRQLQRVRREIIQAVCIGLSYFMKHDNERVNNRTIAKTGIRLVKFIQKQKGEGKCNQGLLEGRGLKKPLMRNKRQWKG